MEDKLSELEQIFNKVMNIPKKYKLKGEDLVDKAESIKMSNTLQEENRNEIFNNKLSLQLEFTENYNKIVEENLILSENIKILEEKLLKEEQTINSYKEQIDNLNIINYNLKQNEKILKDTILNCRGAIRVFCRIKPTQGKVDIHHDDTRLFYKDKCFEVNHIFDQKSTQSLVFEEIKPEIESIFDGYNICVFAYGQTGSGKTYTMEGRDNDRGLIYKSLEEIGKKSNTLKDEGYCVSFKIQYIEIYNETIKDLIKEGIVSIVHDQNSIRLKNCQEISTPDILEATRIIKDANCKRVTAATKSNLESSRSHSIFILKVFLSKEDECREGSLCLIDLAGSERLNKSKSENDRLKETQHINKSLSALGNVIASIKRKDVHVPYRDSKLTHIMQNYLSKNSRTSMIVTINPENIEESICSLRFAVKVSECCLGPINRNITKII